MIWQIMLHQSHCCLLTIALFSVLKDKVFFATQFYFAKIFGLAFQWKMNFNYDPTKQTQEIIFSRKSQKQNQLNLFFSQVLLFKLTLKIILAYSTHAYWAPQKTSDLICWQFTNLVILIPSWRYHLWSSIQCFTRS